MDISMKEVRRIYDLHSLEVEFVGTIRASSAVTSDRR